MPVADSVELEVEVLDVVPAVAANKADNDVVEKNCAAFEELGFPVFAVSALHNRGFEPAMDLAMAKLPPPGEEKTVGQPLRVAVIGRPNAAGSTTAR